MNKVLLNTVNLDDGVIIKKGGGGGGVTINNQEKSVSITENGDLSVVHDAGFTGLSKVNVSVDVQPNNQDKVIEIVENGTTEVTADAGFTGLGKVSVNVNVPTGGGSSSEADVEFFDYDGTLLYAYSKDEFLSMTEMPPLPTRSGLTCQSWNYDFDMAQSYVNDNGGLQIGATYITDNGNTRLYITLPQDGMEIPLNFAQTDTVVVDWGDGSAQETKTSYWGNVNTSHVYEKKGKYCIVLDTQKGNLTLKSTANMAQGDLLGSQSLVLTKLEIGNGVSEVSNYVLKGYSNLTLITIPNGITRIGEECFSACKSLKSCVVPKTANSYGGSGFKECMSLESVMLPDAMSSTGGYFLNQCHALKRVTLPAKLSNINTCFCDNCMGLESVIVAKGTTSMNDNAFQTCRSLMSISLPEGLQSIPGNCFYACSALKEIQLPKGVGMRDGAQFYLCESIVSVKLPEGLTSISSSSFYYCRSLQDISFPSSITNIYCNFTQCKSLKKMDLSRCTSIPSMTDLSTDAKNTNLKIIVPDVLYEDWIVATNWSALAQYTIKKSDWDTLYA